MESEAATSITQRIKEAEAYLAMGMLDESLAAYNGLLASPVELETATSTLIRQKIALIQKSIQKHQREQTDTAQRQSTLIKQAGSEALGPEDMLVNAAALKELGLLREAAEVFEKVLAAGPSQALPSAAATIVEWLGCALKTLPARTVVKRLEEILRGDLVPRHQKVKIFIGLAKELDKCEQKVLAQELFNTAVQLMPNHPEVSQLYESGQVPLQSRYEYLLQCQVVTPTQLQQALEAAKQKGQSVESILISQYHIAKATIGKSLSSYYRCAFKEFNASLPVPIELIGKLKKAFLLHSTWVPLRWDKDGIEILVDDPNDLRKTDHIRALMTNQKVVFCVGIKEDIVQYIETFYAPREEDTIEESLDNLETLIPDIAFEEEQEPEDHTEVVDESSSQVVKFVDQVLITAFRERVSDIHIEPSPVAKTTSIRFRMDGVCNEYRKVPNTMAPAILSRLKIMANLDIAERRLPQDGKIKMKRKGIPSFELRMSTMPTTGGHEDAVLRILAKAGAMKVDDLGLSPRNLEVLKKIIVKPYGLILVVGPTGSGKTTTLHSALGHINKPEIKIWTAEDPVEITQPGLRQVEVKPKIGFDFARVMRGFLRLDPDVIMIGEMRDKETASTGVEASLTGHLVFSTLHTNSAPETVTRLLDMGLNPLNFSDAFLGVLAQRLMRRMCPHCCQRHQPSTETVEELIEDYGREAFSAAGIRTGPDFTLARSVGCDKCAGAGFKGRLGIHELMEGTKAIKHLIKRQATTDELFAQASQDGMTTLKQDGIFKVCQGLSDINEVRRVCID
jgi:type II secretory ATPase GspE/PulE/Tfp pilus assembly ATPase PilB-like protein